MAKPKKLYRLDGVVPGISESRIKPSLRFTRAYSEAQAKKQFWDKFKNAFPKHSVNLINCEVVEIEGKGPEQQKLF